MISTSAAPTKIYRDDERDVSGGSVAAPALLSCPSSNPASYPSSLPHRPLIARRPGTRLLRRGLARPIMMSKTFGQRMLFGRRLRRKAELEGKEDAHLLVDLPTKQHRLCPFHPLFQLDTLVIQYPIAYIPQYALDLKAAALPRRC